MYGILLDTNIYGELADLGESGVKIIDNIYEGILRQEICVHNFRVIRNELREGIQSIQLLKLYDAITASTIHDINPEIEKIAEEYYDSYKKFGGGQGKTENFMKDLRIVAFSSLKRVTLIYSNDKRTMFSDPAIRAYKEVNFDKNLPEPTFHTFDDLIRKFG